MPLTWTHSKGAIVYFTPVTVLFKIIDVNYIDYGGISSIRGTLVGNVIVYYSDVVGTSPVSPMIEFHLGIKTGLVGFFT